MELIDLFDKHRRPTGYVTARGNTLATGMYRLVVHICIFNSRGEMLIQQRQSTKKIFPDKWDISVGGQVDAGETSEFAAQREIEEELGLSIDMSHARPYATMSFEEGFDDIYIVRSDAALSDLTLQQEEVKAADWASREQVQKMIRNGAFIPYHPVYIDFLFSLPGTEGTFEQDQSWNESGK